MTFKKIINSALLITGLTLFCNPANAQCAGGNLLSCPTSSNFDSTGFLYGEQPSRGAHTTVKVPPQQILSLLNGYYSGPLSGLPSAAGYPPGAQAFVTDCREPGETAGHGSSCVVYVNAAHVWKVMGTNLGVTN